MANDQTHKAPMDKKEESGAKSRLPLMIAAGLVIVVGGAIAAFAYLAVSSQRVYIEDSTIEAPTSPLSAPNPGTLEQVYVSVGDTIQPNTVVAEVGTQLITAETGGLVISTNDNIGGQVAANSPVVTVIDPTQLRVDGQLEEDKGLADVAVGDRAIFTADAFPGQTFDGVVSEISPTSQASDVVFSVSDQREEQKFDVQVSYDVMEYPQLKNGMSAKIWVYKN